MPILQTIGVVHPTSVEFFQTVSMMFLEAFSSPASGWSDSISEDMSSGALRTKFPISLLSLGPGFRKWTGMRQPTDTELKSVFIDSDPWERTIDIPLDELNAAIAAGNGQSLRPYLNQVPALVRQAAKHRDFQAKLFLQGSYVWPIDGLTFFHATHPVDPRGKVSGTYKNLYTSFPLSIANWETLKTDVSAIKDPSGESTLGLELTGVLVPPALRTTAQKILRREAILEDSSNNDAAAAVTNIFLNDGNIVTGGELNNQPTVWYGLAMNTEQRAIVQQWKDGGEPELRILAEGSEFATNWNMVRIAAKLFGNVGAALPFTIFRCEG